jgi:crossover junction endodeoxyribonuclease RuvC
VAAARNTVRSPAPAPLRARALPHPYVRVLGIDPGTLRLGYGVVECRGSAPSDVRYVECGVITASARDPRPTRLAEIGRGLRELLTEVRPDAIAMEEAFYGKNVQSTLALGEARGVAIFVAAEHGLSVSGYAPATIKQAVVGHGRATKDQIGYLVRALLSLRRVPEPDAADALAIAICHARSGALTAPAPAPARRRGRRI